MELSMIKEELEKEAEDKGIKYADSLKVSIKVEDGVEGYAWFQVEQAYERGALDFAEPREKQIAELSKHIVELQEDKGELTDRVKELEAQIEKLKNCINCKYFTLCGFNYGPKCNNRDKWEIKEK